MLRKLFLLLTLVTAMVWGPLASADPIQDIWTGEKVDLPTTNETKSISVTDNAQTDAAIEERLKNIYSNIQELKSIQVKVNSGVVALSGELLTTAAQTEAIELASQVEGVVEVEDRTIRVKTISVRLRHALDNFVARTDQWIAYLPLLMVALIVMIGFWLLSRWVLRWDGFFQRFSNNAFIVDLLKQVTRALLIVTGLFVALEILDATALLGSLLGAAGLLGLAVGFAIRDTVENYLASILLSVRQPFSPNDHIVLDSYEGKVIRLTSRATILMTFDGNHVRIPNAIVYKGIITNYTRNPERRFRFQVGVDTGVDLTAARSLAIKTTLQTEGVIASPAPACHIETLGDSNVVLTVYGWTDQLRFDFLKVRSAVIQNVKDAFDAADFEMPEPIYRLRLQGMAESMLEQTTQRKADDSVRAPVTDIPASEAVTQQINHAIGVEKDTELDVKIQQEAAQEADLLNDNVAKE
ncbi:mechanosensitive ion channel [Ketobacter sp. MCCC 1A13808]|uniref:mechanosensitive ion channel domain-containing protein n=1 Tax=Ketobacter sp. MCCC 1A13808 TaxID=2602738 RepID=UPI0012EC003F|nr:mechanosensitive ion channel domain-containing protein [Ketobacter sp. MCCC 1A13808]MVF14474.1 mechanosensitive ion channel [Ketobacter sp. MCCC 1A13808]